MYARQERDIQGFDGETRGKDTIWKDLSVLKRILWKWGGGHGLD